MSTRTWFYLPVGTEAWEELALDFWETVAWVEDAMQKAVRDGGGGEERVERVSGMAMLEDVERILDEDGLLVEEERK